MAMQTGDLLREYPFAAEFFTAMAIPLPEANTLLTDYFQNLDPDVLEDIGADRDDLIQRFHLFMARMMELRNGQEFRVESISILGGHDKNGKAENASLLIKPGDVICAVGPTGSGKTRLLADIEWMARGDTPTGRTVLINGQVPPLEWRFSLEHKLVAQLSQNMNFVVDMTVRDFVQMHGESRMVADPTAKTDLVMQQANQLAGEPFTPETPVTSLSGGQSRALMIADTAFLSSSPIVLIDEIENAGIDRKAALRLLVNEDKIVIMATHDPLLALMGKKRLILNNGGIQEIMDISPEEKSNLETLEQIDRRMTDLRNILRSGQRVDFDLSQYFKP
jgi:ABC-type lipoprotein export system ATPase subunit